MDNLTSLLTRYNSRRPHGAPRMTMEKLRKEADLLVPWMEEYLTSIGVNPYPSPKHREPEAKRGSKALRHYVYVIEHTSGYFYIGKHSSDFEFGADNYWGSGTFLHRIYHAQGWRKYYADEGIAPPGWSRGLVQEFDNEKDAFALESVLIGENIANPQCVNVKGNGRQTKRQVPSIFICNQTEVLRLNRLAQHVLRQKLRYAEQEEAKLFRSLTKTTNATAVLSQVKRWVEIEAQKLLPLGSAE